MSQSKKVSKLIIALIALIITTLICVFFLVKYKSVLTANKMVEIAENPAALMFLGSEEDTAIGELYFIQPNEEREKIGDNIRKNQYQYCSSNKSVIFMDAYNTLYYKLPNAESSKVSESVIEGSFRVSQDEKTIVFLSTTEEAETASLYIKRMGQEKEKIDGNISIYDWESIYLSEDGQEVYYIDADDCFYKWSADKEKEKISSATIDFNISGHAYSYINSSTEDTKPNTYIKFANENDAGKIASEPLNNIQFSQNGLIAAFISEGTWKNGTYIGELYLCLKGSDKIKVSSDVQEFIFSEDGRYIYYKNEDNSVYVKPLPNAEYETYKHSTEFMHSYSTLEKSKLCSDVKDFSVSPNGKNSLYIDNDANLYAVFDGGDKIKVASDVTSCTANDTWFVYTNKEGQLFYNSCFSDSANIKDNSHIIASSIINYTTSNCNKYVSYISNEDNSMYFTDGLDVSLLVPDVTIYDIVLYKNDSLYEKRLEVADFAGFYKSEELGYTFKIMANGNIMWYIKGEEHTGQLSIPSYIDKYASYVFIEPYNDEFTFSVFAVRHDGQKYISLSDQEYVLQEFTEDEFNSEIEKQKEEETRRKEAEAKRIALENKKKALEEKGKEYVRKGYKVSKDTQLYYSPNRANIAYDLYYELQHLEDVYSYKVSDDGNTLWLELCDTYYGDSIWVIAN